jgi:hypothetical protein
MEQRQSQPRRRSDDGAVFQQKSHHDLPTPDKTLAPIRLYAIHNLSQVGEASSLSLHTIRKPQHRPHHASLSPSRTAQRLHHRPALGLHHRHRHPTRWQTVSRSFTSNRCRSLESRMHPVLHSLEPMRLSSAHRQNLVCQCSYHKGG